MNVAADISRRIVSHAGYGRGDVHNENATATAHIATLAVATAVYFEGDMLISWRDVTTVRGRLITSPIRR